MEVVILCGGTGTRLSEKTELVPKPLIEIGGRPLIWHIMKHYAHYQHTKFILALGYKQEAFKEYFLNMSRYNYDIVVDSFESKVEYQEPCREDWRVVLVDTGRDTLKGGRLKRASKYIAGNTFMLTYGDAVSNVHFPSLLEFHRKHGKLLTITGVHPTPRFGEIVASDTGELLHYQEKLTGGSLINGGFMVANKGILDILDEHCDLEIGPFDELVEAGEIMVYRHDGFWRCMDTLNDMKQLQLLWDSGKAMWKVWLDRLGLYA